MKALLPILSFKPSLSQLGSAPLALLVFNAPFISPTMSLAEQSVESKTQACFTSGAAKMSTAGLERTGPTEVSFSKSIQPALS